MELRDAFSQTGNTGLLLKIIEGKTPLSSKTGENCSQQVYGNFQQLGSQMSAQVLMYMCVFVRHTSVILYSKSKTRISYQMIYPVVMNGQHVQEESVHFKEICSPLLVRTYCLEFHYKKQGKGCKVLLCSPTS